MYSATLTHAIMYHRKEIWTSLKSIFGRGQGNLSSRQDVHSRLMSVYKEVPGAPFLVAGSEACC